MFPAIGEFNLKLNTCTYCTFICTRYGEMVNSNYYYYELKKNWYTFVRCTALHFFSLRVLLLYAWSLYVLTPLIIRFIC